jgi:hypothetical protein
VLPLLVVLSTAAVRAEGTAPVLLTQLSEADRERARGLMDAGDAKMAAGDAAGALSAYRAADEIVRVPTTGIEVGRAQHALGLWVEARDTWVQVSRYPKTRNEPAPFTQARLEAEGLAIDLAARIPTLILVLQSPPPKGLEVSLDARQLSPALLGVPLRVNPGAHRLRASAPGYASREVRVVAAEKTERRVELFLERPRATQPALQSSPASEWDSSATRKPSTAAMWTGFGVAAAGAAVGTATGIWAYERTGLAYEQCNGTVCPPEAAADIDQARTAGTISTVAFIVGGAGLALGIWQAVTLGTPRGSARPSPTTSPRLAVVPTGAGARLVYGGSFQ